MVKKAIPFRAEQIEFPGKHSGEEFRFYFRKHWLHPMRGVAEMFVWLGIFGLLTYISAPWGIEDDLTRRIILILLTLIVAVSQLVFITKMYHHFLNIVIVTDKKIHQFKRTLIAVDMNHNVDLWTLQDITKRQRGLFQNIFGFGTLNLEVQNSHITIHFVPNIDHIQTRIAKLREHARAKTYPPRPKNRKENSPEGNEPQLREVFA